MYWMPNASLLLVDGQGGGLPVCQSYAPREIHRAHLFALRQPHQAIIYIQSGQQDLGLHGTAGRVVFQAPMRSIVKSIMVY